MRTKLNRLKKFVIVSQDLTRIPIQAEPLPDTTPTLDPSVGQPIPDITLTPTPESALAFDEQQAINALEYWRRNIHKVPVLINNGNQGAPIPTPNPTHSAYPPPNQGAPIPYPAPRQIIENNTPVFDRIISKIFQNSDQDYQIYLPSISKKPDGEQVKVFVIAYFDIGTGQAEFPELVEDIRSSLGEGSRWHGEGKPAVRFEIVDSNINASSPPSDNDNNVNIQAIYNNYDLCSKIQNESIDQIWMFTSTQDKQPPEFMVTSDQYSLWGWLGNQPNCGRPVPLFTFLYVNTEYDVNGQITGYFPAFASQAIHSFAHYVEAIAQFRTQSDMLQCDFVAAHGRAASYGEAPGVSQVFYNLPSPECSGNYARSNQYAFSSLALQSKGLTQAVCGDVHFPPNSTEATFATEYIYSSEKQVQSICNNWHWGTNPPTESISCETWNGCMDNTQDNCRFGDGACAEARYLIWWLQRIPSVENDSLNRNGQPRMNWWELIIP